LNIEASLQCREKDQGLLDMGYRCHEGVEMVQEMMRLVRVWDLPTRLFHWALALCFAGAVLSAKLGGNAMVWHMRLGCAMLTLIAFRLLWGFLGGRWSRFSSFLYRPAQVWRYLRGRARPADHFEVGHNPLGALSVLLMLACLLLQVGSGLIADDEIAASGPLVRFVSSEISQYWTAYHKDYGQWVLFALVGLHLLAVVFKQFIQGQQLIGPMFNGDKVLSVEAPSVKDDLAARLLALALLAGCAAAVYWLAGLDSP
jgi:cytochrome b